MTDRKEGLMDVQNVNVENRETVQVVQPGMSQAQAGMGNQIQPMTGRPMAYNIPDKNAVYRKKVRENFSFFGVATGLYALLYAFCMYKNGSGVAFPFFVAGSLLYMCLCLSKLEISLKKSSTFQMICMMLLAVATFATDDGRIIFFNKTGIFLLALSMVLNQFYDTQKWRLGKYFKSILQLLMNSMSEMWTPIQDAKVYFRAKQGKYDKRVMAGILGAVIMIPVLVVILALLGSADIVFKQALDGMLELVQVGNLLNIVIRIAFCFVGAYAVLSYITTLHIKEEVPDKRTGEPVLMIVITAGLTLVYAYFSVIQIVYLFMGKLQLPEGYTYAEYAREGFFQLLAVGIINLIIVLVALAYFKESKVLKVVLTLMSFCTFIMIASSAYRMIINIQYYYLTFLRILVIWSLVVLFIMFCGVVINIWKEQFNLFKFGMTVVSVLYIALAFSHPDYWIAKVNLSNTEGKPKSEFAQEFFRAENDYQDFRYISTLSADAAPVVFTYMEENDMNFSDRYLERMQERTEDMNWRTYNISRHMAVLQMEKYGN